MQGIDNKIAFIKEIAELYQKKLAAVHAETDHLKPNELFDVMRIQGERTLNNFREIQTQILSVVSDFPDSRELIENLRLMSTLFDEMQVLFFVMLERYYKDKVKNQDIKEKNWEKAKDGRGED